jgi:hypothetical protein
MLMKGKLHTDELPSSVDAAGLGGYGTAVRASPQGHRPLSRTYMGDV